MTVTKLPILDAVDPGPLKAVSVPMNSGDHSVLVSECRVPILTNGSGAGDSPARASAHGGAKAAGWTPLLVLAATVAALGSALPVGYNIGVINTPATIIKAFCNESMSAHYGTELSDSQLQVLWATIVSIFLVGGMAGSMSGGWAADRVGRRGAIGATLALNLVAAAMFAACKAADSVELLLLARLLVGFSSGLSTSVVPMYLTELAPLSLRGALGVVCPLGINIGVLAGQFAGLDWLLGTPDSWHQLLALFGPLSVAGGLLLFTLPESPKYLFLVRGEEERGLRELARIRRMPEERLSDELRAMRCANKDDAQADAPLQGEWTAARVLRAPELVLPLVLVCVLQAGQQLSGINAVFYYSSDVFRTAGLTVEQAQYATLGCGGVNLATSLLSVPLVNGCGRRVLMLFSTVSAVLCLVLLGTAILTINSVSWMSYVAIVCVLLYVLVYGFGLGPIPYFIGSELFDVGPRPVGMALGSLSNWTGNLIVGMLFPTIQSLIGPASFYVFATITAAQAIMLKIYLPETKGRDTAEVADMLRLGFKSKVAKTVKNINQNDSA